MLYLVSLGNNTSVVFMSAKKDKTSVQSRQFYLYDRRIVDRVSNVIHSVFIMPFVLFEFSVRLTVMFPYLMASKKKAISYTHKSFTSPLY